MLYIQTIGYIISQDAGNNPIKYILNLALSKNVMIIVVIIGPTSVFVSVLLGLHMKLAS